MADEFDRYFTSALAPPERTADRDFVVVVRSRILLDERAAAQRRRLLGDLAMQLVGLFAVTAAALWIGRDPQVAKLFAGAPFAGALILVTGFGLVIALFSRLSGARAGLLRQKLKAPLRPLNKLNGG